MDWKVKRSGFDNEYEEYEGDTDEQAVDEEDEENEEYEVNTDEEAADPRETISEEAYPTLTRARGVRQGNDQKVAMDPIPLPSSTAAEISTLSMPLTKSRSKTARTKPYARRSAQKAQCTSNQKMLRRIRGNFRNPESAKAALIAGEILAQPLGLRLEGERLI